METPGIKRQPNGTYQVRVSRKDYKDGSIRNLKGTATSLKEARLLREKLIADLNGGKRSERIRLSTFARSWLEARLGTIKPSVSRRYASALDLHIIPALGQLYLDAIDSNDVTRYVVARLKSGAAGNTVLNELRLLRTMAKDALHQQLCDFDWADRVKAPPVNSYTEENPNLLRIDELARLFDAIPGRWKALVTLIALTGLRWGEATGLRWSDLQGDEIRIERANWRGTIVLPKTEKSKRRVAYPAQVAVLLGDPPIEDGFIFTTREGTLHTGSPLRAVLDRACKKAGVRRITTHGLRRTFIDLARRETSIRVLQSITGHTTAQMIAHYSQPDAGERREALDAVTRRLEARTGSGRELERNEQNPIETTCDNAPKSHGGD